MCENCVRRQTFTELADKMICAEVTALSSIEEAVYLMTLMSVQTAYGRIAGAEEMSKEKRHTKLAQVHASAMRGLERLNQLSKDAIDNGFPEPTGIEPEELEAVADAVVLH
jgi:hypothetical protein